ncbi:MAG: CDP-alcohol phosphatidyltransferase family protein [Saprospiraceae bacterium]|nr:CDP-alcohol phosphatidyltransferase family protein [Saprospiraceae bacterium]
MSWLTDYKSSIKMVAVEEYFDLYFYRPFAFVLVKLIYPTNITPNQLTLAAIGLGIIAGFQYAQGIPNGFIYGAVFFVLYNIVDCSDGQLARLKKNGTYVGRIIDGIADYIATSAVYIGIGIGFANHQTNPSYWWSIIVLAGLSTIIQSVLVDYYRNRFLDFVLQRKSTFEDELDAYKDEYQKIKYQKNKWLDRLIIDVYIKYSNFQSKLISKKQSEKLFSADPQDYYQKNKVPIRFWVSIGPTSQITLLVICSFFNRLDLFFWILIFGFNSVAAMMWFVQRNIDKTFR